MLFPTRAQVVTVELLIHLIGRRNQLRHERGERPPMTLVRALKQTAEMHFIVWDGGHYREIVAHREGRRFGVDLSDYHG